MCALRQIISPSLLPLLAPVLHDHADHDVRDHNSDADNDDHVVFVIVTQGIRRAYCLCSHVRSVRVGSRYVTDTCVRKIADVDVDGAHSRCGCGGENTSTPSRHVLSLRSEVGQHPVEGLFLRSVGGEIGAEVRSDYLYHVVTSPGLWLCTAVLLFLA